MFAFASKKKLQNCKNKGYEEEHLPKFWKNIGLPKGHSSTANNSSAVLKECGDVEAKNHIKSKTLKFAGFFICTKQMFTVNIPKKLTKYQNKYK